MGHFKNALLNMKRSLFILFAGIVALAVIFLSRPKQKAPNELSVTPTPISTERDVILEQTNSSLEKVVTQTPAVVVAPTQSQTLFYATKPHTIEDWTNAVPNLKPRLHSKYYEVWDVTQINEPNPPKVILSGVNGTTVQYAADSIDIGVRNNQIRRIELQSPRMNIDATKEMGLQLCNMLGLDSKGFVAWCDQVGNHWLDAPLYSSQDKNHIGFQTLRTYNDEKPWIIDFVIAPP